MRWSGGALYAPPARAMDKAFRLFTLWTVLITFALIVIGAIVAITSIGPKVTAMWQNTDAAIK